ncbi:phenylalanyl-tRNA synthetase subunit beta [Actinoplanes sp. N902-109]|uniref:phenylalanyl-tRNA synthetase subunit beta n=1 Tax=Actinoplanes sp. (strain N902-109) TaxID=649831 RepID=UPI0003294CBC|nr:phenylalanyl-tRNA synthetase subunit beta [Actinoplanes sp. N902-109]AGL14985.1 phenylalanyl-tRNA synthetase subunit beta [Actinoplanes sp. N902-109]
MRISLAWLAAVAGRRIEPDELVRRLREAGAGVTPVAPDAIEVVAPPMVAHLASVRGVVAAMGAGPAPAAPALPGGLLIEHDDPGTVLAAARLTVPGPVTVPDREAAWLGSPAGSLTDVLAFVRTETGVRVQAAPAPEGRTLRRCAGRLRWDGEPLTFDDAATGPDLLLVALGDGRAGPALARAAELLTAWAGATVHTAGIAGPGPARLVVDAATLDRLTGPGFGAARGAALLTAADLPAGTGPDGELVVHVPAGRTDVDRPETVAAEIVRLAGGYRRLTPRLPGATRLPATDPVAQVCAAAVETGIRFGLRQVCTLVLRPPGEDDDLGPDRSAMAVHGRTGKRHQVVRGSLLPGVVEVARAALRAGEPAYVFEVGAVPRSATPGDEAFRFTAVLAGPVARPGLADPEPRQAVFADLVALAEAVGRGCARGAPAYAAAEHPAYETVFEVCFSGTATGRLGVRTDGLLCLDLELSRLAALPEVRTPVRLPDPQPPITVHMTVEVPPEVSAADVRAVVGTALGLDAARVRVKDVFGQDGPVSLTLSADVPPVPDEPVRAQRRARREAVLQAVAAQGWPGR